MLGEESGGDILMELKKDNTYMNIPIIMVTAKIWKSKRLSY